MNPFPPEVEQLNSKIQQGSFQKGLSKVAQVASVEIVRSVNQMARKAGIKEILRAFYTKEQAEMWLDK